MDFKVTARETSDKQKSIGMVANVQVDLVDDSGRIVVRLYDGVLRQGSNGYFLASPQRPYEKDGETKYASYWRTFPEDRDSSDKFNEWVVDQVQSQIGSLAAQSAPATTSAPQNSNVKTFPFGK